MSDLEERRVKAIERIADALLLIGISTAFGAVVLAVAAIVGA